MKITMPENQECRIRRIRKRLPDGKRMDQKNKKFKRVGHLKKAIQIPVKSQVFQKAKAEKVEKVERSNSYSGLNQT